MASISKNRGEWLAQVRLKGQSQTKRFETRRAALEWAEATEDAIRKGNGPAPRLLSDVFDRYGREVSTKKPGKVWELRRLEAWKRYPIASLPLEAVSSKDVAGWRDVRLTEVSAATVLREMNLLSHVFSIAVREWELIEVNPCSKVSRPKQPEARERRISEGEIEALETMAGYVLEDGAPEHPAALAVLAMHIAIETGMRLGEICQCAPEHFNAAQRTLMLPAEIVKTRRRRTVPLSKKAVAALGLLFESDLHPARSVNVSKVFATLTAKAGIEGLTFHDTRHEAITRLALVLSPLELAKAVGHTNLNQLMTYYDESAASIAERLG